MRNCSTDNLIVKFISGLSTDISKEKEEEEEERLRYNIVAVCHFLLISALISCTVIGAMGVHNDGFYNMKRNGAIALLAVSSIFLIPELITQIGKVIVIFIMVSEEANKVRGLSFAEKAQLFFDPASVYNKLQIS